MTTLAALFVLAVTQPRIGLSMNVREGGGEADYLAALRQQIRLGLDGSLISLKWDEYESQAGKPLADALGFIKLTGQDALLTIATIDTVKRRLPPDIADRAWDDQALLDRCDGFLRKIAPQLGKQIRWISLGNEVDGYLSSHPGETAAYLRFLDHERNLLHEIAPGVKVGVTTTWMGLAQYRALIASLQKDQDVAVFTYYPLSGYSVLPPAQAAVHVGDMLQAADGKPLLLQEIGYPSSERCSSSEKLQADFVKMVFAAIRQQQSHIAFASFFVQMDFGQTMLGFFSSYYGQSDSGLPAFLGSLGLQDSMGRPKPAWREFQREMSTMRPLVEE